MKGKNVLITGSMSGVGLEIARSFTNQGCNVVLNGAADKQTIDELTTSLSGKTHKAIYINADISNALALSNLIYQSRNMLGSIDILVNNAGLQHVDTIENHPDDMWDRILAINLSACFHTIKQTLPYMKKQNWGRIINIASTYGLAAAPNKSAYIAAKHGLIGLTKAVALECAQYQITCNALCPGLVLTPAVEKQVGDIAKNKEISKEEAARLVLSDKQPSMRFISPKEIGSFCLFLCTTESNHVNGAAIPIDGAWTAR